MTLIRSIDRSFMHSYPSSAWCVHVVLGNVWSNTRRLLKQQGVIPKTSDSARAEKFRESFFRDGRKNHKNYKVKQEVKPAEEENPEAATLPSTTTVIAHVDRSIICCLSIIICWMFDAGEWFIILTFCCKQQRKLVMTTHSIQTVMHVTLLTTWNCLMHA